MARRARADFPGAPYRVISRGNQRHEDLHLEREKSARRDQRAGS